MYIQIYKYTYKHTYTLYMYIYIYIYIHMYIYLHISIHICLICKYTQSLYTRYTEVAGKETTESTSTKRVELHDQHKA